MELPSLVGRGSQHIASGALHGAQLEGVKEIARAVNSGDFGKAIEEADELLSDIQKIIIQKFPDDLRINCHPSLNGLLTLLESNALTQEGEVKYRIACPFRLLAQIGAVQHQQGASLQWTGGLTDRIQQLISATPDHHLGSRLELDSALAALKSTRHQDPPLLAAIEVLTRVIQGESLDSGIALIKGKGGGSDPNPAISLFLLWLSIFAQSDSRFFDRLKDEHRESRLAATPPLFYPTVINAFADCVWSRDDIEGSIVSDYFLCSSTWAATHRAIYHFAALLSHPHQEISDSASHSLLNIWIQQEDPRLLSYLEQLAGQAPIYNKLCATFKEKGEEIRRGSENNLEICEQTERSNRAARQRLLEINERETFSLEQSLLAHQHRCRQLESTITTMPPDDATEVLTDLVHTKLSIGQTEVELERLKEKVAKMRIRVADSESGRVRAEIKRPTYERNFQQLTRLLTTPSEAHSDSDSEEEIPDYLRCPITQDLLENAVSTPAGQTYSESAIRSWLGSHNTDPCTREALTARDLKPNYAMRGVVEAYQAREGEKRQKPQPVKAALPSATSVWGEVPAPRKWRGVFESSNNALPQERPRLVSQPDSPPAERNEDPVGLYQRGLSLSAQYRQNRTQEIGTRAVQCFEEAARYNHRESAFQAAVRYANGYGVLRDRERAFNYCLQAAAEGYPRAQYCLATLYEKGIGTESDPEEAQEWLQRAADNGHEEAQDKIREQKESEAVASAAIEGMRLLDRLGVQENRIFPSSSSDEEVERTRGRDRNNNASSSSEEETDDNRSGGDVLRHERQGAVTIEQAVKQAHARAQRHAIQASANPPSVQHPLRRRSPAEDALRDVLMEDVGYGTNYRWEDGDYERGILSLRNAIQVIATGGYGEGHCQAAAGWLRKAAESGDARAQVVLGRCYERGVGVAKNMSYATSLYARAAHQGNEEARERLRRLRRLGPMPSDNRVPTPPRPPAFAPSRYPPFELANLESYWMVTRFTVEHLTDFQDWVAKTQQASQQIPSAQYNLALLHYLGLAVPQNYEAAVTLLERAAEAGHIWARYWLGVCFSSGRTNARVGPRLINLGLGKATKSYPEAELYWMRAAESGHRGAYFNLGVLCALGRTGAPDYEKAKYWFKKVGDIYSEFNVACINFVQNNVAEAVKGLQALEKRGHPKVLELAAKGGFYEKSGADLVEGLVSGKIWFGSFGEATQGWLTLVMDERHYGEIVFDLSVDHQLLQHAAPAVLVANNDSRRFVIPTSDKSSEELRAAVSRGDQEAQFLLGKRLLSQAGQKEMGEALLWLERSAQQGFVWAQLELGRVLLQGHGVSPNPQAAYLWLLEAAKQYHSAAFYYVGYCHLYGQGTFRHHQALDWFERGAREGCRNAQYELGGCHERGDITPRDLRLAAYWYDEAAKQGLQEATLARQRMRWA